MGLTTCLLKAIVKKNQFGEVMLRTEIMCRLCTTSKHSVLWSIHLISLLYGHFSSNMSIKYLLVWSTCQLDFPALKLYNKFMYLQLLFALQLPSILSLSLFLMLLMLGTCWVMSTVNRSRSKNSWRGSSKEQSTKKNIVFIVTDYHCSSIPILNFDGNGTYLVT